MAAGEPSFMYRYEQLDRLTKQNDLMKAFIAGVGTGVVLTIIGVFTGVVHISFG